MPWTGNYYYRSVRVNGKPRRQYVGRGPLADMHAHADGVERMARQDRAADLSRARSDADAIDADIISVERLAEVLARAALIAAGCHQHKRGEWRRKRKRS